MPGVPGAGGRIPKRSDARRNKSAKKPRKAASSGSPGIPPVNARWHPEAKAWYRSLRASGQSQFYEPSDWALAHLTAEAISRELSPQPIGVADDGKPVLAKLPPKGASLLAWQRAMTSLCVTEGDRRRAGIELVRAGSDDGEVADVDDLAAYRERAGGPR